MAPPVGIKIGGGISIGGGINIGAASTFTITAADILGFGGAIYQDTTPLGTNGVDGFQNTAAQFNLVEGYYAQNLSPALVTAISNYVTALGIPPNNSTGYVYNVTWAAGSSISSGLVKLGFYNGNGDTTQSTVDIQTIDPTDTNYQQNNTNNGTTLAGTFLFPATFTIYSPLTDKLGWC
jgi:hypothetical protein